MRLPAEVEERRRIQMVKYLVEAPRSFYQVASFDGYVDIKSVPVYIKRLRAKGVRIKSVKVMQAVFYQLDMPLDEAMALIYHKNVSPFERHEQEKAIAKIKARFVPKEPPKYNPIGDAHPWWGILTRSEPIDCRLPV